MDATVRTTTRLPDHRIDTLPLRSRPFPAYFLGRRSTVYVAALRGDRRAAPASAAAPC